MSTMARHALNRVGRPLRRFFDPRFDRVVDRLTGVQQQMSALHEASLTRMRDLERRVAVDVEVASEFLVSHARSLDSALERMEDWTASTLEQRSAMSLRRYVGAQVRDLDAASAELLNYAASHRGFAAQVGLWFNAPISLAHAPGMVRVTEVNERIVEVPYVFGVAATLPPDSTILDVGAAESTVALSLASSGYRVTALDVRGYPLTHPNITNLALAVQSWEGPPEPLDLVICLSTVEHLGLPAYGGVIDDGLDRATLLKLRSWLSREGRLVLTVPYGQWSVDDFERVYDDEHLDALLEGWSVIDRRQAFRSESTAWTTTAAEAVHPARDGSVGVALITARPSD